MGESFIKVPIFGAVSYLTLAVSPFCIAFAVVWAVYRNVSFAWIGQDILVSFLEYLKSSYLISIVPCLPIIRIVFSTELQFFMSYASLNEKISLVSFFFNQGIALIITVLQIVRIPNLKVISQLISILLWRPYVTLTWSFSWFFSFHL